jgi:hypothetical protein
MALGSRRTIRGGGLGSQPALRLLLEKVALLQRQYANARQRHSSGVAGDRSEIIRAEQLASAIEAVAYDLLAREVDTSGSEVTLTVPWPFAEGAAAPGPAGGLEKPVAKVWRATPGRLSRTDATYDRFVNQLAAWVAHKGGNEVPPPLCPSDTQNRALTEALRTYAAKAPGSKPVAAPVTYRDGSAGPPFPLRSISLSNVEPEDGREVLAMTLLSVRHVDMDIRVDGAWFRNRQISLPRPAGLTDRIAFEQSIEQLKIISADGPVTLHLYQTGLPAAVVGLYRAFVHHHLDPTNHAVAIVPFYYAGDSYAKSQWPWTVA